MTIYCMSDIHGHFGAFEKALKSVVEPDATLILLGDYLDGPDDDAVMERIIGLKKQYGNRMTVLLGNHEQPIWLGAEPHKYENFIRKEMKKYKDPGNYIFVHAGVDETLGANWRNSDEGMFMEKYPPTYGKFERTIIAGHTGTNSIRKQLGLPESYHIYFDRESHFYIDGTVKESGVIPVLMICDTGVYEIYDGVKNLIIGERSCF